MEDDIIDAGPLGPRVLTAVPMDDYELFLGFDNGEQRIFDVKPSFKYDVYKPILDKDVFKSVIAVDGTVEWPGDIDYCPDTLYARSVPVPADFTVPASISSVAESQQNYKP